MEKRYFTEVFKGINIFLYSGRGGLRRGEGPCLQNCWKQEFKMEKKGTMVDFSKTNRYIG